MEAKARIKNHKGERIYELSYDKRSADMFHILSDIVECAIIGDRVSISFDYDSINAERLRNFVSIAQLYEYAKNK